MKSYRRSTPLSHLSCAGETGGAYDPNGADGPFDPEERAPSDDADGGFDPDEHGRARDSDEHDREHADDAFGRAGNAGDADGAFDPDDPGPAGSSPLPELVDALDLLEASKLRVLDRFRDVAAWGGTAQTTGYSQSEYLALIGRLPSREAWKYDLLVRRLPACPVTAVLLESGQITFDQAISIVVGTKRLSGQALAGVERAAAEAAVGRNERGDDPDVDGDVEQLVQQTRTAADQDRRDRDRLDRNRVRVQPDLFGAGQIFEDWTDPEGFQTRLAAIEHAAGPPTPELPRGTQLAEGSLATARAWLAGRTTHPLTGSTDNDTTHRDDANSTRHRSDVGDVADVIATTTGDVPRDVARPTDPGDVDGWLLDRFDHTDLPLSPDDIDLGPSSARPTFVVRIDIRDLDGIDPDDPDTLQALAVGSPAAFGRLAAAGRLSSTPWLGRQLLDTLACNLDLLVAIVDGERPLAEFRRTRRLPDRIRRQVLWRDLGCRWPTCRAPIAHCDVHHLDENPTNHDVDNLLTLCRRHHRRLHSTFWHPRLDGHTGRFDLLRTPDGTPVHTTYPRGTPPQRATAATASGTATTSGGDPTKPPEPPEPPEVG